MTQSSKISAYENGCVEMPAARLSPKSGHGAWGSREGEGSEEFGALSRAIAALDDGAFEAALAAYRTTPSNKSEKSGGGAGADLFKAWIAACRSPAAGIGGRASRLAAKIFEAKLPWAGAWAKDALEGACQASPSERKAQKQCAMKAWLDSWAAMPAAGRWALAELAQAWADKSLGSERVGPGDWGGLVGPALDEAIRAEAGRHYQGNSSEGPSRRESILDFVCMMACAQGESLHPEHWEQVFERAGLLRGPFLERLLEQALPLSGPPITPWSSAVAMCLAIDKDDAKLLNVAMSRARALHWQAPDSWPGLVRLFQGDVERPAATEISWLHLALATSTEASGPSKCFKRLAKIPEMAAGAASSPAPWTLAGMSMSGLVAARSLVEGVDRAGADGETVFHVWARQVEDPRAAGLEALTKIKKAMEHSDPGLWAKNSGGHCAMEVAGEILAQRDPKSARAWEVHCAHWEKRRLAGAAEAASKSASRPALRL